MRFFVCADNTPTSGQCDAYTFLQPFLHLSNKESIES
jgi:hypothetical protein